MSASCLNSDVTGLIANYLDPNPKTNLSPPSLTDRVNSILQIIELGHATRTSVPDLLNHVMNTQNKEGRAVYGMTDLHIGCLAHLSGQGNVESVRRLLNAPKILTFKLQNEELPWQQPRYVAFAKAIEMACIKDQPEMLKFLFKHPFYQTLVDLMPDARPLTRWQRANQNHSHVKLIRQKNHEATYGLAAAKTLFQDAAKKCCELGRDRCLKLLYKLDQDRQWLQDSFYALTQITEKHDSGICHEIILKNIDTSEPLGWVRHRYRVR